MHKNTIIMKTLKIEVAKKTGQETHVMTLKFEGGENPVTITTTISDNQCKELIDNGYLNDYAEGAQSQNLPNGLYKKI